MRSLALLLLTICVSLPAAVEPPSAARFRLLGEALLQAQAISGQWDKTQRDCAGFVRYLYRKSVPSSEPLWRTKEGALAPFLTAGELLAYNFDSISRGPQRDLIETGDLLAFHLPHKPPAEAFHLMVLLKPPAMAKDKTLVVYHNGGAGEDGQVRKVWLGDLVDGPPEWRPSSSNPRFLGTFRWKGWAERFSKGR